jgi:hypothetical protein
MKTIIVINDNSNEALHAGLLALDIAEKVGANLLITNEFKIDKQIITKGRVAAGQIEEPMEIEEPASNLAGHLRLLFDANAEFIPEITEMDISDFRHEDLARFVISKNIWMIVTGATELADTHTKDLHINIQSVLNHVRCPLLLVPEKSHLKGFDQIVYIADLRYCRIHIVRFLAELALPYMANVLVDHLSAKGLPHMEESYALKVFDTEIAAKVNYDQVFFNNIRERDLTKAVDTMINGMHSDLLVLVNHRFHFEEILGRYVTHALPASITIPLLIFPY